MGFEFIKEDLLPKKDGVTVKPYLPIHSTTSAAAYDLRAITSGYIMPHETVVVHTGIKAYMPKGWFLGVYGRSSLGAKKNVVLANTVGIVDADYYSNPDNDGEVLVALHNRSHEAYKVNIGDKIAQVIFQQYGLAEVGTYEEAGAKRTGGFGSTGA